MRKLYQIIGIVLISVSSLLAETPKREMRSIWLTTVWRNDWPTAVIPADAVESAKKKAQEQQKTELTNIMDQLKAANINTIYFQIRSMCDAFYKSSYEPWSQFLVSSRGADPGYDPLEFAIEEAHKRGMELHAWLNPYRYSTGSSTHGNLSTDYAKAHPEWLMDYGGSVKILNPGHPEARQRIVDVIEEVVTNYDIDGVLFDDYFYVSGGTANSLDQDEFEKYNPDNLERGDWRRQNVNKMVADVYRSIKSVKPYVVFGISPAGVAASSEDVAAKYGVRPSPGGDWQYNGIYSDPLAWLSEGTIDYISPQLYWEIVSSSSNMYERLTDWWSEISNHFGRFYYSSNSVSAMSGPDKSGTKSGKFLLQGEEVDAIGLSSLEREILADKEIGIQRSAMAANFTYSEMARQAELNRTYDWNGAPGFVLFATKKTIQSAGFLEYMKNTVFTYPSLLPAIPWIKAAEQQDMVEELTLDNKALSWNYPKDNVRYVIYAVPNAKRNDEYVFSNSTYLLGISYTKQYTLPAGIAGNTHKIAVSVLDRYGNEYPVRVLGEGLVEPEKALLKEPQNESEVILPVRFFWEGVAGADFYVLELSTDVNFDELLYVREVRGTDYFSGQKFNLEEDIIYYWRVKTYKANMPVSISESGSFTGKNFSILQPADGAQEVSITPVITWMAMSIDSDYTLEIATSNSFYNDDIVFTQTVKTTELIVPEKTLVLGRKYYTRVTADYDGMKAISKIISFTIENGDIHIPEIISPVDGVVIEGTSIEVSWKEQAARGFRVELSKDNTFPSRDTKIKRTDAYTYTALYEDLDTGLYYIRVMASNDVGTTDPSEVVSVHLKGSTGSREVMADESCYSFYDKNRMVHIMIRSEKNSSASVTAYSLTGVLLNKNVYSLKAGENIISPDMITYPSGLYLLKIESDNVEKVLKIKN